MRKTVWSFEGGGEVVSSVINRGWEGRRGKATALLLVEEGEKGGGPSFRGNNETPRGDITAGLKRTRRVLI